MYNNSVHFQVHTICSAFCKQATVLIEPVEMIGTIVSLSQYSVVSAQSKRCRGLCSLYSAVGLWQVTDLLSVASVSFLLKFIYWL